MLRNALLIVASVVVALALCEGVLRLTQQKLLPNPGLYYLDPVVGKRMKPGWSGAEFGVPVTTNALGLRNREVSFDRAPGVYRILALGDSWTFGFQVREEDSYPRQLERVLNARALARGEPKRYEVINAGVVGYSTEQEAAYFAAEGRRFQPDLVVVAYYPVNDTHAKKDKYDRYNWLRSIHPWLLEAYTLPRKMYLNQFIKGARVAVRDYWRDYQRRRADEARAALAAGKAQPGADPLPPDVSVAPANQNVMGVEKDWTEPYQPGNPDWEDARAALVDIGRTSDEIGARGIVVLLPDLIDLERYTRLHARIEPLVRAATEEAGLDWLDLEEAFRPWRGRETEVRAGDLRHPNPRGFEVIATQIADRIERAHARGVP